MPNGLDTDHNRLFVGPDLGPNCRVLMFLINKDS